MPASQSVDRVRRPPASSTRSAGSTSPVVVRTPVTCGTPGRAAGPVTRPSTRTPRRTETRGSSTAAAATTDSTTGRRPVTTRNRSSPGCAAPSCIPGGRGCSVSTSAQPAASRRSVRPGSSLSQTSRKREWSVCAWWNCATPERRQEAQASAGPAGAPSGSASSTVTSWPSRASTMAAHNPTTPPPQTTIPAMCPTSPDPRGVRPRCRTRARADRVGQDLRPRASASPGRAARRRGGAGRRGCHRCRRWRCPPTTRPGGRRAAGRCSSRAEAASVPGRQSTNSSPP